MVDKDTLYVAVGRTNCALNPVSELTYKLLFSYL
nr:MAG TPA: hypothetical protein [Caudoviricetes sp.]